MKRYRSERLSPLIMGQTGMQMASMRSPLYFPCIFQPVHQEPSAQNGDLSVGHVTPLSFDCAVSSRMRATTRVIRQLTRHQPRPPHFGLTPRTT